MAEKKRLPRYQRASTPPPMRLTERDKRIMEAVHAYDGMLGFSQLKRMFFTGESQAKQRLKLLYQNKYLNRPNKEQRRRLPEMIYWLDKRGAQIVASLNGTPIREFSWRKQPRWFQVEHDLAVNDFRLDMEEACQNDPDIELDTWIPESEFWAYPDIGQLQVPGSIPETQYPARWVFHAFITETQYPLSCWRLTEVQKITPAFSGRKSCLDWLI